MNISRALLIGGMMVAASFASVALTPGQFLSGTSPRIDLENAIPRSFGDWKVDPSIVPINPSPEQQEALDQIYDQIVSRTYVNSQGQRIMLSVAYGSAQTRKMRAHRQEVCYAAQGFQIKELRHEQIEITGTAVPVTRMVAVQNNRKEPVTYWFTMGDYLVLSYLDRQVVQLKYAFSGFVPDGYLLRVSSVDSDVVGAFDKQLNFSRELMNVISPELRRKLLGST